MWRFQSGIEPALDLAPVTVNGKSYAVDAIFTDGRTASASLREGRIVIRIPRHARTSEAQRLFANLKGRISRMMEKHPERFTRHSLEFGDGQVLRLLGRDLQVVIEGSASTRAWAHAYSDRVVVRLPASVSGETARRGMVTRLVTRALCRSFAPAVESRVNELNRASAGIRIDRVVLKDIRSRWGSYSSRSRKISLSVRLLFAPQEILDYVIVHELCHGMAHNHGNRFWSHVSRILPDYRDRIKWLRLNGDMLGCMDPAGASTA